MKTELKRSRFKKMVADKFINAILSDLKSVKIRNRTRYEIYYSWRFYRYQARIIYKIIIRKSIKKLL